MSLNLHSIVRGAITANYADATFSLYRSAGQINDKGIMLAAYHPAVTVQGNFQSEGDAALNFAEMAAQNTIIRKLYLYATNDRAGRPWAGYRPLARSGDYVVDVNGDYWLAIAVLEDFSDAGWVCLRVQLQTTEPTIKILDECPDERGVT